MSENDNDTKAFGVFVISLARSAGYLSPKDFVDALNDSKFSSGKVRTTNKINSTRLIDDATVSRWRNGKSVPKGRKLSLLVDFFEKKGKLNVSSKDESYIKFFKNYDLSLNAQQKRREIEKDALKALAAASKHAKTDYRPGFLITADDFCQVDSQVNTIKSELSLSDIKNESSFDAILSKVLEIRNASELSDFLRGRRHDFDTTHALTKIMDMPGQHSNILRQSVVEVVLECAINTDYLDVSSICSNILCTSSNVFIEKTALSDLENIVFKIGKQDIIDSSMMMSSLAYIIARNNTFGALKLNISKLSLDRDWADHDYNLVSNYYGSKDKQLESIVRHMSDRNREGLMMSHDAHRLVRMLESGLCSEKTVKNIIIPSLISSSKILYDFGLFSESKRLLSKF